MQSTKAIFRYTAHLESYEVNNQMKNYIEVVIQKQQLAFNFV